MIKEQVSGITPTDISFFENLIKLEELTGFIESNGVAAGSPQVGSILNSATSIYSSINNLLPKISEAAQKELTTAQDLYGDIVGVNSATLGDIGGESVKGIADTIMKAWNGITSFFSSDATDTSETEKTDTPSQDTSTTPPTPVAPIPPTPPSPEQPAPSSEPSGPTEPPTPSNGPVPRPTVKLDGSEPKKSGYATRYLPKEKPAQRPISGAGPTYYIRTGPGRYQPATSTDLSSGTQLFMKNPNPALRMVYPYVKVESMIKKARRATRA